MAANRIRGIVLEIGGDMTKLDKAIAGTNKEIGNTQKQLKDVERLLKLDPKNTELLSQKQRLLTDAVSKTGDKLTTMRKAADAANKAMEEGKLAQDAYDAIQRELADTERAYKDAEDAAKDFNAEAEKLSASAKAFASGAEKASKATKGLSTAAGGLLTAMAASVPATQEYRAELSMLENNAREAGVGIDAVRGSFEQFVIATDETDSSVEALSNLLQAGFTESNLQKAVEGLTGAYLRFPDTLKIESLADSLQETLATGEATGQFAELLERCGLSVEDFNEQLSRIPGEVNKQNYVLGLLASQGLNDTYKGWTENNAALVESRQATLDMQDATAQLAEKIEPITTKLVNMASTIVGWFSSLDDDAQNAILGVLAAVAMLSPVASTVGSVANAFRSFTDIIDGMSGKSLMLIAVFTVLAGLAAAVVESWDDMSPLQKAVAVLGLVAAAALAAAIAVGAFHSAATIGLAAVGIAVGVAAVVAAVAAAQAQAEKSQREMQASVANAPRFGHGGVAAANRPFMAVVGDNPNEPEVIAPESMIRKQTMEAIKESGIGGGQTFVFRFEGSLAQLGRLIQPHVDVARTNKGDSMRR